MTPSEILENLCEPLKKELEPSQWEFLQSRFKKFEQQMEQQMEDVYNKGYGEGYHEGANDMISQNF